MTETDPSRDPRIEALIEAEVTRAMTPYRLLRIPRDVLEELETMLRLALHTHPDAQQLLRLLAPDPALDSSDTVAKAGGHSDAQGAKEAGK